MKLMGNIEYYVQRSFVLYMLLLVLLGELNQGELLVRECIMSL